MRLYRLKKGIEYALRLHVRVQASSIHTASFISWTDLLNDHPHGHAYLHAGS